MKAFLVRSCAALAVAATASMAVAEDLLIVDLTTPNEITITATAGLSDVSASGSDTTGIYLQDFYSGPRASGVSDTLVSGDITNAENPTDNSPNLFTSGLVDTGLNLFSFSSDTTVTFTAGSLAFVGSGTWTLPADDYAEMLAGNASGDIWFPADDAGDLPGAQVLGQYRVIPEPASLSLLALGGLALLRRR